MAGKGSGKVHEKHQLILANMLREEENKFCADCLAKGKTFRVYGWQSGIGAMCLALFCRRSALGLVEYWSVRVYQMCWDPQKSWSTHISCEECQSGLLDT